MWGASPATDSHGYRLATLNNQGLVTAIGNAVGQVLGLEYDVLDRLVAQTNADGVVTTHTYDDLGRVATRLIAGTATERFYCTPRGLSNYVDALSNSTWYAYDALGRLSAQTNANNEAIGFTYSAASDLLTLVDGRGKQTSWGYDLYGRVTSKTNHNGMALFCYEYDAGGRLTNRWSVGKGNTRYAFDAVGNLTTVTYEANTNGFGTNVLTFAYDKDARLTSMVDAAGTTAYTYRNGLLAAEDGPWASDAVSYEYTYGRRQSMTVAQSVPATWQEVYGYDAENQLVCVTVTNAWQSRFTYDALGWRRVRAEYDWGTTNWVLRTVTRYVYDGMLVVQERDANNLLRVTYTRGRDLSGRRQGAGGIGGMLARTDNPLLASSDAAAHAYYHADGNGNITALVDASGTVVARYLYDPYGNLLAKGGPLADANLYRFSSKEQHANSGLYYYGCRFYDPSVQRWVNRDPLGERAGLNLYRFARNASLAFVDAWGLWDILCILEGDLVPNAGISIDLVLKVACDDMLDVGLYGSIGPAGGMNAGAGAGFGFSCRRFEGPSASLDLNLNAISPTLFFDGDTWKDFNGVALTWGPGLGGSVSVAEGFALFTLRDLHEAIGNRLSNIERRLLRRLGWLEYLEE